MEVNGQLQAPTTLTPEKNPGIQIFGGYVGSRTGLNILEKKKKKIFVSTWI
jgi:hypothetical protein